MDEHTLLILLTIFVFVAAVALLIQAAMLAGLFLVARRLQEKVMPLIPQVEGILGVVKRTTERVEKHIEQIGTTSNAILDVTKQQLHRVDELLGDATTRAKVQMERAEMVLDDTMTRVTDTVSYVQSGVLRPVREVYGVLAGIRTALAHLGRSGRSTVDHATSDEEMFI
ncbi:MAG: hypothetical protein JO051_15565 [Acidobacteriaceae bacterium]|nr:hypothetical protein [Acidobacteriaceae bacterium]